MSRLQDRGIMSDQPKICKNCRFFQKKRFSKPLCMHSEATLVYERPAKYTDRLVYGVTGVATVQRDCHTMRDYYHFCGPEGKYFE